MARRFVVMLAAWLAVAAVWAAAPPVPWSAEQKKKLAERDRLEKSLSGLIKKQPDEVVAAMERILAIEMDLFGETDLEVIGSLQRLARWHEAGSQFDRAEKRRQEVLRLQKRRFGKSHWQVTDARIALEDTRRLADMKEDDRAKLQQADAWNRQSALLYQQGKAKQAIAFAVKVSEARKEVLGEKHPSYAASLSNLALIHLRVGESGKALRLFMEAHDVRKSILGEKHPDYALSLSNLGGFYLDVGEYGKALPLLLEARNLRKEVLGEKHPDYARSLDRLAVLYLARGEPSKALPLLIEARDLRKGVVGTRHHDYATSLNSLGGAYLALGEYDAALALFLELRDVVEQVLDKRHPLSILSRNNLAGVYQVRGEYGKALPLFLEARDVSKRVLGVTHPDYALSLDNLAVLYLDSGESSKALPLLVEARDLRRKVLGEKHPEYATSLNNLGLLYKNTGELDKALPLLVEARDLRKEVLGEKHPKYAITTSMLGLLYQDAGQYSRALPLLQKALEIHKEVLGEKHPEYAASLNNLAVLSLHLGEYDKALPLLVEARDVSKKALGEKHPGHAASLNNLASLHLVRGEQSKALSLYLKAAQINKEALGEKHPGYAGNLNNLALCYQASKKPKEAAKHSLEAFVALQGYLDDGFDLLGERQRNQILQNALANLAGLLSFQQDAELDAAELYAAVLWWKGRVAARGALDRLTLDEPQVKENVEKSRATRLRLARLTLQTPPPEKQEAWLKQVQMLTEEKEALEAKLTRHSSAFRKQKERLKLTPTQLAKQLPDSVAFVDLIEYAHFSPPKGGKGKSPQEQRLLAFVSRRGKTVVAVPLGELKPIAEAIARWREQVHKEPTRANRKAIDSSAAVIREKVWDKLAKHLGDAKTVIVSPDGVLCQFPLAALPGGKADTYLIEEVAVAQVASAAQLFGLLEPVEKDAKQGKGLLTIGGIDYGAGKAYGPLPGTEAEATLCRDLFRKSSGDPATLLTGKQASAAALRKKLAERPRYVHLATHGYFEPADKVERLLKGLASRQDAMSLWREQVVTLSNLPGLRCGLALSGANQAPPEDDPDALPNVLTGQDLESMDLRGCEVAVLSACQTALGDVQRSQGVLGLQRALHAAGVRTTVTSLWSVQDAATAELMEEFYKRLWGEKKLSRLEALRQAQLAILRDPERVRRRTAMLLADAKKRGVSEDLLRGPKGRFATDLPEGGKLDEQMKPKTSPEAWWAAFVLCGDWR